MIETAFHLHRTGALLPDSFVVDMDTLMENAKNMLKTAKDADIRLYFMLKQLGRNPYIAKELVKAGYEGAVVVDYKEADIMMKAGIPIGNIGHLVQVPNAQLERVAAYGPEVITVFSKEKIKAIDEETLEFVDITTVEDRLRGKNTIVHEFTGKVSGWCRERFIPVDYDADGRLWHVLYCVENIDEEKRRENRLMYLAQTDLMTGIRNRGSGENKITEYLVRKQCGLLCLLDCDKFKSINDTYGHVVGDKVIIAIADTLRKSCRDDDVVLRLGGDEFAVFIPGMLDKERAEAFFDRLFSNIEHIDIAEMNGKHILLSLGACFYDGMDCITFDQLYRRADTAMYDSKKKQGYSATIFDAKQ